MLLFSGKHKEKKENVYQLLQKEHEENLAKLMNTLHKNRSLKADRNLSPLPNDPIKAGLGILKKKARGKQRTNRPLFDMYSSSFILFLSKPKECSSKKLTNK